MLALTIVLELGLPYEIIVSLSHPKPQFRFLSKLLTYCVLRPTQPTTLSGTGNEY